MKRAKKSNRPLIVSIVSITVCLVLLIGTTVAWFTDSVSNTGNRIEAGTLDVELYKYVGADTTIPTDLASDWTAITNTTSPDFIFDFDLENWQPGDTETSI